MKNEMKEKCVVIQKWLDTEYVSCTVEWTSRAITLNQDYLFLSRSIFSHDAFRRIVLLPQPEKIRQCFPSDEYNLWWDIQGGIACDRLMGQDRIRIKMLPREQGFYPYVSVQSVLSWEPFPYDENSSAWTVTKNIFLLGFDKFLQAGRKIREWRGAPCHSKKYLCSCIDLPLS